MSKSKIWVLVTDGVRARILRGLDNGGPDGPRELISRARSTHLQRAISDKSGAGFPAPRKGRTRGAKKGPDPIRRDMQDFALEMIQQLESHRRAREFQRLVVVAAPTMLGILQEEMPPMLRPMIVYERATNIIRLPEPDLRNVVQQLLASRKDL